MDIKLQKRTHPSLRKLTKVDENNNVIEGQELYVRVEDVPSNLINKDATPLSEEVLNSINWKDNHALLFRQATELPKPIFGTTQIVSLENGQIWCVPGSNATAFEIGGAGVTSYLKKNFQAYEPVIVLGSNTKVGALPSNFNPDDAEAASTYLDISEGNIDFKINGSLKQILNPEKVSFIHGNNEICIKDREAALKYNSGNIVIGIMDGRLYIKGNSTEIIEDLNQNKLNAYTSLNYAVYGNSAFHLEFNPDQVRLLKGNTEMLKVESNGEVYVNGSSRVIDTSNIDSYIQTYFNANFKNKFLECYDNLYYPKETLEEGAEQSLPFNVAGFPYVYRIDFSDTSSGEIMRMYFKGTSIDNLEKEYKKETGYYYLVSQYYATDDSDEDSISVLKYNASGAGCGRAWIRGIYVYRRL